MGVINTRTGDSETRMGNNKPRTAHTLSFPVPPP